MNECVLIVLNRIFTSTFFSQKYHRYIIPQYRTKGHFQDTTGNYRDINDFHRQLASLREVVQRGDKNRIKYQRNYWEGNQFQFIIIISLFSTWISTNTGQEYVVCLNQWNKCRCSSNVTKDSSGLEFQHFAFKLSPKRILLYFWLNSVLKILLMNDS